MMMMRDDPNNQTKQVHFANGFPPKELVPTPRLSPPVNMHGGVFVGLHDDVPSRLTKHNRSIPPLAKGRGQFSAVNRIHDKRQERDDPFTGHKGSEKTGFTAYPIKHNKGIQAKPRMKSKKGSLLPNFPRSIGSQTGLLAAASVAEVATKDQLPDQYDNIMSDVEKEKIISELAGIDEVYHHICQGNRESLYSLVSPIKGKRKKYTASVQSLHVTPVKDKPSNHLPASHDKGPESTPRLTQPQDTSADEEMIQKMPKQPRSILVPLPFFKKPTRPPQTAPARHKAIQDRPRVYPSSRSAKHPTRRAFSSLSGWSSPSIINFSPVGLPEVSRPGTRGCTHMTGSIVGVQNRSHTGKVAIVAALQPKEVTATPPATAATGLYTNQSFFDYANYGDIDGHDGMELDSVGTPDEMATDPVKGGMELEEESPAREEIAPEVAREDMQGVSRDMQNMSLTIVLNVTTDEGVTTEDVEIYDPAKRDIEKELHAAQEIKEAQENAEKRQKELETLLDDYGEIIKEVNQLEEELHSQ